MSLGIFSLFHSIKPVNPGIYAGAKQGIAALG